VLIVSSGRTVFEVAQGALPELPGVQVTPTIGGQDDPNAWYQTNEITRMVAAKIKGTPSFLYAPALPGPDLHERLLEDPSIRRVTQMWSRARCALVGVGAPPAVRASIPAFVPTGAVAAAVGDICSRFFSADGSEVAFPGSDRLIAASLSSLRRIPACIAVAAGAAKVPGIVAGARAGYFNRLVTDVSTAQALLAATGSAPPADGPPAVVGTAVADGSLAAGRLAVGSLPAAGPSGVPGSLAGAGSPGADSPRVSSPGVGLQPENGGTVAAAGPEVGGRS
jgi:DNA-binding transcriptional regulator LsrR (DeoR family)